MLLFGGVLLPAGKPPPPLESLRSASPAPRSLLDVRVPPELPEAVREGRWGRVRELLGPRLDPEASGAEVFRTLLGRTAHDAGRLEEARRLLDHPPRESPGPLEDWALWTLSECLISLGEPLAAQEALAALSSRHPDSPLADRAHLRALELAVDTGRLDLARQRIEEGRARPLPADLAETLERLAWELAEREDDRAALETAGRRLATFHPSTAEELEVRKRLGLPEETGWSASLAPEEAETRGRALLDRGEIEAAIAILESVEEGDRSSSWSLLAAEAQIADDEGLQALALLASLVPETREEDARIAWLRARALLAASRSRSPERWSRSEREIAGERARDLLQRAAAITSDPILEIEILGRWFDEVVSTGGIDEALAIRRRILGIDPGSSVGRELLWRRAWDAMETGDLAGAIRYFSELSGDPSRQDRWNRGARYWIGRSWEDLGHRQRAESVYRDLSATDVVDFYRRHALRRLGVDAPVESSGAGARAPWPTDPLLDRARFLTDAGLDALAEIELAHRRADAEPRAAEALHALILARRGDARSSMSPLRRAFPEIATPVQARVPREARELYYPLRHRESVSSWARARNLPPALVFAVVRQESAFDVRARSRAGARGLMQMMPATARELAGQLGVAYSGNHLYDPDYNLRLGTRYLQHVIEMFDGRVELALAGYNGGPYRIKRWWREAGGRVETDRFIDGLPLSESRAYVHRILLLSDSYARLYGLPGIDVLGPVDRAARPSTGR